MYGHQSCSQFVMLCIKWTSQCLSKLIKHHYKQTTEKQNKQCRDLVENYSEYCCAGLHLPS